MLVQAHNVLLASSSSIFRNIFKSVNQPQPVIFLRGVKSPFVTSMMQVIHYGETKISNEEYEKNMYDEGVAKIAVKITS